MESCFTAAQLGLTTSISLFATFVVSLATFALLSCFAVCDQHDHTHTGVNVADLLGLGRRSPRICSATTSPIGDPLVPGRGAACRICWSSGASLIHPGCACRGSSAFVHTHCLARWLIQRFATAQSAGEGLDGCLAAMLTCEVCNSKFSEAAVSLEDPRISVELTNRTFAWLHVALGVPMTASVFLGRNFFGCDPFSPNDSWSGGFLRLFSFALLLTNAAMCCFAILLWYLVKARRSTPSRVVVHRRGTRRADVVVELAARMTNGVMVTDEE